MKKARSIIASIILLCLCITGCTDSTTVNTSDFSDAIGDSPEAAVSPSESYIIESLNQSEFILEVEAVTESNDPNGKLNIDGGYNACVFFSSTLVDQSNFSAKSVVEKGTSCGGCIEVYSSEEDATARNEYLAKFDGGLLDSGSHTVIGTIIIRTSEKLTKEQQTELTRNLVSIITSSEQPTDQIIKKTTDQLAVPMIQHQHPQHLPAVRPLLSLLLRLPPRPPQSLRIRIASVQLPALHQKPVLAEQQKANPTGITGRMQIVQRPKAAHPVI